MRDVLERFGRASLPLAIVAVSTAAPLVRLAPDADPLALACARLTIAGTVLALLVRPRGLGNLRAWGPGALAGVLLAVHFASWFWSLRLTTVASSVTLVTTAPLFAAVLAPRLAGDRTEPRIWGGALAALAGIVLIARSDGASFGGLGREALLGDALALLGALSGSLYLIIGRRVRARVQVEAQIVMTCWGGGAALLVACLIMGISPWPTDTRSLVVAACLALGPHLMGHGLLNVAVRRRPAQDVQLALLGEPILSSLIAAVAFAEIPPASFYPGGILVLAGLAWGMGVLRPRAGGRV